VIVNALKKAGIVRDFQGKENHDGRSHHGGTVAITTARGAYHGRGGPHGLSVAARPPRFCPDTWAVGTMGCPW